MKTWEKIMLYPISLYIWLTDGIMKMSKKWKPAMAMMMAVVMLCGMLPATAMAASTAKVKVGGISLADGQCLTGNGATAATTWAEGDDYVALYKDGVLYINNLEISGEGAAISFQESMDLIIDVSGENTLVRTDGSCIDITSYTYGLVIQGSGTLTATGSGFGIWVRENVTIQGDVTLTVEGTSDAGIASNRGNTGLSDTSITIKDNAFVTATGGKHGLGGDHDRTPRVVVEGNATVVAKGGTYAIRKLTADTVSSQRVLASTDITGSNKEEYVSGNNTTYKYVEVNYGTGIAYLDSTGAKQYCDEYISVDGSTTWNAGWYYVGSDVTISDRITVTGDVHLILGDNAVLNAERGILVSEGQSLTIYAQSTGNTMGKLNATSPYNIMVAGIGGGYCVSEYQGLYNERLINAGTITINGGNITATGGNGSAGIGGGCGNNGVVTINGGVVSATGGVYGAGIGGGWGGNGGIVTINGGTVTANGDFGTQNIGAGREGTLSYKVTFDANGGNGSMYQKYLVSGTEYELPANGFTAPAGDKPFKCWNVDGEEKNPGEKITITKDITVEAVWTIPHTCNIQPVEKVWPNCDNGGKEAYYKCDGCGKFFEDAEGTVAIDDIDSWGNLPKTGHEYGTLKAAQPEIHTATELKAGVAAHYFCDVCDTYFTEDKVATDLDALTGTVPSHNYATVNGYKGEDGHADTCACGAKDTVTAHTSDRAAATETDPVKCSVCGYEIAPAFGHTHKNLTKVPAETADCEKDGNIEYYTCTCGKWFADATASVEITDKDGVAIKGGHKYGTEWKSDADNHWNECACGDKGNTAAHKDENTDGKCDVCDYNVGLPTTPDGGNKPSDTSQAGDNTQLGLWIALLIVGSFGIVAITLFVKKKYSVR